MAKRDPNVTLEADDVFKFSSVLSPASGFFCTANGEASTGDDDVEEAFVENDSLLGVTVVIGAMVANPVNGKLKAGFVLG